MGYTVLDVSQNIQALNQFKPALSPSCLYPVRQPSLYCPTEAAESLIEILSLDVGMIVEWSLVLTEFN